MYYDAVNVTFKVTKEEAPEQQGKDAPVATSVVTKTNYTGKTYYGVAFEKSQVSDVDAYLRTLRSAGSKAEVTVDETNIAYYFSASYIASESFKWTVETDSSYNNYTYLDFTSDCFPADKKVAVVVKVEGYKDLIFYVKDGKIVSADDSDNSETEEKDAPTFTANTPKTDEAIVLTTESNDAAEYLEKVSGVSYKEADVEESTSLTEEQYATNAAAKTITINAGVLTEGTYTITITAEGYKDATVDVTVAKKEESGSDNGGEETGADVPTVAGMEYDSWFGYTVKFEGFDESALDQYLAAVTSVETSDGTKLNRASSKYSIGSKEWIVGTGYGANGSINVSVIFGKGSFGDSETVTLIIKADGYKDLTFTVANGQLVTADTQSAEDSENQASVVEESAQETESQAAVVEESAQETETKAVVETAPAEETVSTEEQAPAEEVSEEAAKEEASEETIEESSNKEEASEETNE